MDNNENIGEKKSPERAIDILKQYQPEREVQLPEKPSGGTLAEAEAGTKKKSDLQTTLSYLLPTLSSAEINRILQPIMVSRVNPDIFIPLLRRNVIAILEEHIDDDLSVNEVVNAVYTALSIAKDGMARADVLEASGSINEQELEKAGRSLGMFGS